MLLLSPPLGLRCLRRRWSGAPACAPICPPPVLPCVPPCRQLYEVLSHAAVARRRLPVLLAVNKTDQGAACHSVEFVRKRLEKEMCA